MQVFLKIANYKIKLTFQKTENKFYYENIKQIVENHLKPFISNKLKKKTLRK
ncbi:MAG: hypothetical protein KatS3mg090_0538 [Patescibacteria group bacterium]|nr:MAG: hypothetical protein KatS3mg090_0538 [Patescibacteria group bacterium]